MELSPAFAVEQAVFEAFPTYLVGCVLATGLRNDTPSPVIDALLEKAEQSLRDKYAGTDPKSLPEIALWRSVFSRCGWSPSKFPASIEALLKRVLRGDPLPRINPIVDLANACSLSYLTPVGAHDLKTLPASLTVRHARALDVFAPMGTDSVETPDENEIVYVTETSVRTRRWVWRQSRDALITPTTTDAFFPVDGFIPETHSLVNEAVAFLAITLEQELGGNARTGFVDTDTRTFPPAG